MCTSACAAGEVCTDGACKVTCASGLRECSGVCRDVRFDKSHCGACGNACATGQVCNNGACETSCGTLTNCSGTCKDTQVDVANCGTCGNACAAGQVCAGGVCTTSCGAFTKCGDVCKDTQVDSLNCGACGTVCGDGEKCVAGVCTLSCPTGLTKCGSVCVNTNIDGSNCGACGTACTAGQSCSGGTCTTTSGGGCGTLTDCGGGACKDTSVDPSNCGTCGRVCGTYEACVGGVCSLTCGPDRIACSGTCVFNKTDRNNCGTCGTVCPATSTCGAAHCIKAVGLFTGPYADSMLMVGSDGALYGWGDNSDAEVGTGSDLPADLTKAAATQFKAVRQAASGGNFACVLLTDGSVKCVGNNSTTYTLGDAAGSVSSTAGVTPVGFESNVVGITAGNLHACGLFADGTAQCWGHGIYGQLGNGSAHSKTPLLVGLTGIRSIHAGYYHTCAMTTAGALYCWGYNSDGQVGDGTSGTAAKPTPVEIFPTGVKSVSPGTYHTCAAMNDGTARCWGRNTYGTIGLGSSAGTADVLVPTPVVDVGGTGTLMNVEETCSGYDFNCARRTDGSVVCWGENGDGQLGNDSTTDSSSPVVVVGVAGAKKIACGYDFACAIVGDDSVKCWGENTNGAIGNGGATTDAKTAASVIFY